MPLFNYKAKKGPKDIIEDSMEAETEQEVVTKLTGQGLFPISVETASEIKDKKSVKVSAWFSKITVKDLNVFTHQLSSLIKSGLPLLSAMYIISEQTENKYFRHILEDLAQSIKRGDMLSDAMTRYPKIFPPLYTAMIKSGEDSGSLDIILKRLAEHREKAEEIKSRIRSALAYPIIVTLVGIGSVVFLMLMVIPQIEKVFISLKMELPWSTQLLIGISNALSSYWYLFLGGIVFLLIATKGVTLIEKTVLDRIKLGLPFIGKFIRKNESAKFATSLSLLLTNGIPILTALDIVTPTLSNNLLQDALKSVSNDIRLGGSMSSGMQKTTFFFPFMTNMIKVGEESGHLDEVLNEIASFYDREIGETIKIGLSMLEPILILIMGLVVGFIVLSMLLPIFSINVMAG